MSKTLIKWGLMRKVLILVVKNGIKMRGRVKILDAHEEIQDGDVNIHYELSIKLEEGNVKYYVVTIECKATKKKNARPTGGTMERISTHYKGGKTPTVLGIMFFNVVSMKPLHVISLTPKL